MENVTYIPPKAGKFIYPISYALSTPHNVFISNLLCMYVGLRPPGWYANHRQNWERYRDQEMNKMESIIAPISTHSALYNDTNMDMFMDMDMDMDMNIKLDMDRDMDREVDMDRNQSKDPMLSPFIDLVLEERGVEKMDESIRMMKSELTGRRGCKYKQYVMKHPRRSGYIRGPYKKTVARALKVSLHTNSQLHCTTDNTITK